MLTEVSRGGHARVGPESCYVAVPRIPMPDTVVYEYVTAVLDLATPSSDGNLLVLRAGEIVTTANITIGGR